jgi:hypothetical protein
MEIKGHRRNGLLHPECHLLEESWLKVSPSLENHRPEYWWWYHQPGRQNVCLCSFVNDAKIADSVDAIGPCWFIGPGLVGWKTGDNADGRLGGLLAATWIVRGCSSLAVVCVGVGWRFGDRVGDITINTLAGGFPDLVTLLISFLLEGGILGEEGCDITNPVAKASSDSHTYHCKGGTTPNNSSCCQQTTKSAICIVTSLPAH